MGFIADMKAITAVQKIKCGKKAEMSISQITGLIINLKEAKKNLEKQKYSEICALFDKMRKCNTRIEMTYQNYLLYAIDIIKKFDAIAPYEKYSGGNETEFSFLIGEIRGETENKRRIEVNYNSVEVDEYITSIVQQSGGLVERNDAAAFVEILISYPTVGKEKLLDAFDDFIDDIVKKYGPLQALSVGSFFIGALKANNIISNTEQDNMTCFFRKAILEVISGNK